MLSREGTEDGKLSAPYKCLATFGSLQSFRRVTSRIRSRSPGRFFPRPLKYLEEASAGLKVILGLARIYDRLRLRDGLYLSPRAAVAFWGLMA